jgi:hypothetical protein
VASLFSAEFYRDVRRYLEPGGLFVQWVQLYETTPKLLATVVAALEENFSDYEFWLANDHDLLIIASHRVNGASPDRAFDAGLRAELERFRIANVDDLRCIASEDAQPSCSYFAAFWRAGELDYFPVLEMNAPLARFTNSHLRPVGAGARSAAACR